MRVQRLVSYVPQLVLACWQTRVLTVSPAPGKASGLEVLIQGKQIKGVTEFLLSRGVPKKWIVSVGVSKKK